jgi:hypothetical protein
MTTVRDDLWQMCAFVADRTSAFGNGHTSLRDGYFVGSREAALGAFRSFLAEILQDLPDPIPDDYLTNTDTIHGSLTVTENKDTMVTVRPITSQHVSFLGSHPAINNGQPVSFFLESAVLQRRSYTMTSSVTPAMKTLIRQMKDVTNCTMTDWLERRTLTEELRNQLLSKLTPTEQTMLDTLTNAIECCDNIIATYWD